MEAASGSPMRYLTGRSPVLMLPTPIEGVNVPEELPYAEVKEPEFKQIELTPDEADLYGTCLMNLIDSALGLKQYVEPQSSKPLDIALRETHMWAKQMLELVQMQAAKAGLGMQV